MDLFIDFETYSETPIDFGVMKYISDPRFKPLCMAYTPFDPETLKSEPTKIWTFQDNPQDIPDLYGYDNYWAFNTGFDLNVTIEAYKRNLPIPIGLPTDIEQWKDIQVVMSKFSLPQKLEDAAEVLNANIKKHPDGKLIVNRCCKKNSKEPTQEDYQKLFDYCVQDNDASIEVLRKCPATKISDYEWNLWRETFLMNQRGIPIDFDTVHAVIARTEEYKNILQEMLPEITSGQITKPTQTARIKKFLNDNGVPVENTTADTLESLIEKHESGKSVLPEACRQVIEIRQAAGHSSVAKFKKLVDMRVGNEDLNHDFLRYGTTNTQRWTGAGYQVHSLPKASVKDPEKLIDRFINFGDIESPIQSAKALCRSVIKAPENKRIYQGDYSSIEYLLLIWLTDMHSMLKLYEEGKSAYIDMAAFLFNKAYEDIDKHAIDNYEYFLGKQAILGCGYQMGAPKFQATCERFGQPINLETAKFAVNGYRQKYKPIKQMWKKVHEACIAAIQHEGHKYTTNKCDFLTLFDKCGVKWLIITLPSNTKLFYHSPSLSNGKYGYEIKHMGLQNYKWTRRWLSPGRITENIVQKLARDLMAYGITTVAKDSMFQLLMTVHDELVCLGPKENAEVEHKRYLKLLEEVPPWAKSIPLRAGGFYDTRYKKD